MTVSNNAFITGIPILEGGGASFKRWLIFLLSLLAFSVGLTCIYLGMRGIMRLGGFVASGGPYAITHPAPGWVWVMPLSVFLCVISIFVSLFAGSGLGGPNLMALSWSALFLSTGWNFLEFGFSPPGGQGLAWGWIVCGVVFVPMGAIPLWIIIKTIRSSLRSRRHEMNICAADTQSEIKKQKWGRSLLLQLVAVGIGIYLGIALFNSQAYPKSSEPGTIPSRKIPESMLEKLPESGARVDFQNGEHTLSLVPTPGGSWQIYFKGHRYNRVRDLPVEIQKMFKRSLENVKGLQH